jgi:hypothetical protein
MLLHRLLISHGGRCRRPQLHLRGGSPKAEVLIEEPSGTSHGAAKDGAADRVQQLRRARRAPFFI